ncbi:hypothetical protein BC828DRAFT_402992 [Blastocladiella britannica]|nr:hypothetical protein BC828DRAFT_402992 [Blastocladiella britannica]
MARTRPLSMTGMAPSADFAPAPTPRRAARTVVPATLASPPPQQQPPPQPISDHAAGTAATRTAPPTPARVREKPAKARTRRTPKPAKPLQPPKNGTFGGHVPAPVTVTVPFEPIVPPPSSPVPMAPPAFHDLELDLSHILGPLAEFGSAPVSPSTGLAIFGAGDGSNGTMSAPVSPTAAFAAAAAFLHPTALQEHTDLPPPDPPLVSQHEQQQSGSYSSSAPILDLVRAATTSGPVVVPPSIAVDLGMFLSTLNPPPSSSSLSTVAAVPVTAPVTARTATSTRNPSRVTSVQPSPARVPSTIALDRRHVSSPATEVTRPLSSFTGPIAISKPTPSTAATTGSITAARKRIPAPNNRTFGRVPASTTAAMGPQLASPPPSTTPLFYGMPMLSPAPPPTALPSFAGLGGAHPPQMPLPPAPPPLSRFGMPPYAMGQSLFGLPPLSAMPYFPHLAGNPLLSAPGGNNGREPPYLAPFAGNPYQPAASQPIGTGASATAAGAGASVVPPSRSLAGGNAAGKKPAISQPRASSRAASAEKADPEDEAARGSAFAAVPRGSFAGLMALKRQQNNSPPPASTATESAAGAASSPVPPTTTAASTSTAVTTVPATTAPDLAPTSSSQPGTTTILTTSSPALVPVAPTTAASAAPVVTPAPIESSANPSRTTSPTRASAALIPDLLGGTGAGAVPFMRPRYVPRAYALMVPAPPSYYLGAGALVGAGFRSTPMLEAGSATPHLAAHSSSSPSVSSSSSAARGNLSAPPSSTADRSTSARGGASSSSQQQQRTQPRAADAPAAATATAPGSAAAAAPPAVPATPRPRGTQRACAPCRAKKVACGPSRPCPRCVRMKCEDACIDPPERRTGRPPRDPAEIQERKRALRRAEYQRTKAAKQAAKQQQQQAAAVQAMEVARYMYDGTDGGGDDLGESDPVAAAATAAAAGSAEDSLANALGIAASAASSPHHPTLEADHTAPGSMLSSLAGSPASALLLPPPPLLIPPPPTPPMVPPPPRRRTTVPSPAAAMSAPSLLPPPPPPPLAVAAASSTPPTVQIPEHIVAGMKRVLEQQSRAQAELRRMFPSAKPVDPEPLSLEAVESMLVQPVMDATGQGSASASAPPAASVTAVARPLTSADESLPSNQHSQAETAQPTAANNNNGLYVLDLPSLDTQAADEPQFPSLPSSPMAPSRSDNMGVVSIDVPVALTVSGTAPGGSTTVHPLMPAAMNDFQSFMHAFNLQLDGMDGPFLPADSVVLEDEDTGTAGAGTPSNTTSNAHGGFSVKGHGPRTMLAAAAGAAPRAGMDGGGGDDWEDAGPAEDDDAAVGDATLFAAFSSLAAFAAQREKTQQQQQQQHMSLGGDRDGNGDDGPN